MARGLADRPKKPKRNGTVGLVGTGDIKERHESGECETTYYRAWKDYPDQAMTRGEHAAFLEEQKRMRMPVNRWNRGGKNKHE
jgi:hypothetical protein